MIKKILLSTMIAISPTLANAGMPYVGGSLGITDLSVNSNGKVNAGVIGKLFGGYGSTYGVNKNIYLGGELNIDLAHYQYDSGSTYGVGASFIPGVLLTKYTMLYGRIGLEAERNTYSSIIHTGTQVGLGLQTSLSKNWDFRTEFVNYDTTSNHNQINLGLVYKFD
jgi:opacity protein-like surface antigen